MEIINYIIATYGETIISMVLTAIAGYLGIALKKLYAKYIDTDIKKKAVDICVKFVEQSYKELHGDEKLNKCIETLVYMLQEKGVKISPVEAVAMIESSVNELNSKFNG